MAAKQEKLHPLLGKLSLVRGTPNQHAPTARDILNHLLQKEVLKDTDVQAAYDSLYGKNEAAATVKAEKAPPAVVTPKNRTRHVALRFYYDGSDFSGLAENVGAESDKSVERVVFKALCKTKFIESRATSGYSRCGRTDRGVSSAGQVVAMQLKSSIPLNASWDQAGEKLVQDDELPKNSMETIRIWVPPKKGNGPRVEKDVAEYPYDKIINNVLPVTIRIIGCCPVSDGFSARFSATTRTYRYFFVNRPEMDLDKMKQALQLFVGKHDFRNFCKMDVEKVYNFERLIHTAEIVKTSDAGDVYYFQILGQAFLWHQIRCIVSILFMVGKGHEEPSVVTEMFDVDKYPGKPSYHLAPERPLVLHHCAYKDLRVGHTAQNLWSTHCQLEQEWEELVLSAARIRNCVDSFSELQILRTDLLQFGKAKLQERFKKQQKHTPTKETLEEHLADLEEGLVAPVAQDDGSPLLVTWEDALSWLRAKDFVPSPESLRPSSHAPLMKRSKGTTYQEKVDSLSKSKRRLNRYEENVVKKRKTKEEDLAFYTHMAKQGGSAI